MTTKKETSDAPFNIPIFTPENKTRIQNLYEKYKKQITYGLGAIVVVLVAIYFYKNMFLKKKEAEAQNMIFMAQDYFAKDSFELALNGKEESFYGFLDVIDDYKMTKTGRLARYYAGVCYMRMGDYEEALRHLKKYRTTSKLLKPFSLGLIGDAYSELESYNKAARYYVKAAKCVENKLSTPLYLSKAALVYEEIGKYKKALSMYEIIKNEYPESQEAMNADKFIGRIKARIGE